MKSFGLILLAEENSKQPRIDSAMWFVVVILMRFIMKRNKLSRVIQNKNFEVKKSTRKGNAAKFCVQGDRWIKNWNNGSGDLRARFHLAKFTICEK